MRSSCEVILQAAFVISSKRLNASITHSETLSHEYPPGSWTKHLLPRKEHHMRMMGSPLARCAIYVQNGNEITTETNSSRKVP
jgi:hypothetical protein